MSLRYKQQILVKEFGRIGQQKITNAKVLIVGAGGLGTPVAASLSASGIGSLGIMDFDVVEKSNLHRQFLYSEKDVGKQKAVVLSAKIKSQNPEIVCVPYIQKIESMDSSEIIARYDLICDCTDNFEARRQLNLLAQEHSKPIVYAAISGWEGYITILNYKKRFLLEDVFSIETYAKNAINNCTATGIINTTCGIAGNIQANEVIKLILGAGDVLDGYLLCFNSYKNIFRTFRLNT